MTYDKFYNKYKKILADVPRIVNITNTVYKENGVEKMDFPVEFSDFTFVENGLSFGILKKFDFDKAKLVEFSTYFIPDFFFFADDEFIKNKVIEDVKKLKLGKYAEV
jgi:hypothetical protein